MNGHLSTHRACLKSHCEEFRVSGTEIASVASLPRNDSKKLFRQPLRAIDIRLPGASYSDIRLHRLVLWAMAAVFIMLSIMLPANLPPAFAQEASNSVNQQVDSLLKKVGSVQTKLDEFGNPDRLFAPDAIKNIRELDKALSSIEQNRQKIEKDEAVAKLTETEKEEYQNKLNNLKDETARIGMQVKTLLQHAQLLQSLKPLIDKSNQDRKQAIKISTIVLYIILSGIVLLLIFAFLGFLWYQDSSRRFLKLDRSLNKTLLKFEKLEEYLPSKFNPLNNEVNSIKSGLRNLEQTIQKLQTLIQQNLQTQKTEDNSTQAKETPLQTFCRFYNDAVEDSNKRNEFMQRFNPIRIGAANAMERRREPSIEPVFQTANDGDYYAVVIEGNTLYAVVPRFDLTFQESIYGPGAMGQVFDCPNYNPQLRYRNVKVVKSAFFEPASAKQRWMLKAKGELDLGQGE
ncbi:hypothetical protein FJZ31_00450 [Candidatus Poribacteria bacterium]|nr:hypothetical protein [Candidatus Poribacteria bacterium]